MNVVGATASIGIQFQQEIFNFNAFDTCAKFFVLSTFRKLGRLVKFSDFFFFKFKQSAMFFFFIKQSNCTNLEYLMVVCSILAVALLCNLDTQLFKIISKRLVV